MVKKVSMLTVEVSIIKIQKISFHNFLFEFQFHSFFYRVVDFLDLEEMEVEIEEEDLQEVKMWLNPFLFL
jgi:hypothetical protein